MKFGAAANESNVQVFEALKWSETLADENTAMDVKQSLGERGLEISTTVCNRIIRHLEGPPLTVDQGVADENGPNEWECSTNTPARDYKETISNRMRMGIQVRIVPDGMQDVILHADRLVEYEQVREKAIGLIDARERLKDPDAMDVGILDS